MKLLLSIAFIFSLTNVFGQSTLTTRVKPLQDTEFNKKFEFQIGDTTFFFEHDGRFSINSGSSARKSMIDFEEYFEIRRLNYYKTPTNLYTFIECTNGVEGYVQINSINLSNLTTVWQHRAPGLSLFESLIEDNSTYVGHLGFLGRINLEDGNEVWSISNVYEKYKIIRFNQIETIETSVSFTAGSKTLSFNKETGEPVK